jgi:hypothetical protein
MRVGEWVVYGIGIEPDHFARVITYALSQPLDF